MKDFRCVVEDYIKKHKSGKRAFAALVSLSMLVSFAVPMILTEPAVSQTRDSFAPVGDMLATQMFNAADDYMISNLANNETRSEKTLLIGNRDWANGLSTYEEVTTAAREKYFLGLAADFCLFLENDFKPTDSDSEGRAAVGGDVIAKAKVYTGNDEGKKYNYQFGDGDYGNEIPLGELEEYKGVIGYANLITNGYIYGVNTWGEKGTDEQRRKIMFVGNYNETECLHYKWGSEDIIKYTTKCDACYGNNEYIGIYNRTNDPLINFTQEFEYMRSQSQKLERKAGKNAKIDEIKKTITFDAKGSTAQTVYFNLNANDLEGNNLEGYTILFENIPEFEGTVRHEINPNSKYATSDTGDAETVFPKIANIVVNVSGMVNIGSMDNKRDTYHTVHTYVNNIEISNKSNDVTDKVWSNNHPYSENILYNMTSYNGNDNLENNWISIGANFNGTILAPDADVTSPEQGCGHLSGALIAKSFSGGQEFGYRPYRGSVDILETQMGYVLPFSKVIANINEPLAGAKFNIIESGEVVSSFTSDGAENTFVNFPTQIAFDGSKNYQADSGGAIEISKKYTIKEVSAPDGFVTDSNTTYDVTINEKICREHDGDLILTDEGNTIPTHVTTEFTIQKCQNNAPVGNPETLKIELRDYYDTNNNLVRRELTIDPDKDNAQKICLNIVEGVVVSIEDGNQDPTGNITFTVSDLDESGNISCGVETITKYANVPETNEDGTTKYYEENIAVGEPETFNIQQFGWSNNNDTIKIDKITFYFYDGDFKGHYETYSGFQNSNDKSNANWHKIELPEGLNEDTMKNVIGLTVTPTSGSEGDIELHVQDENYSDI